MTKPIYPHTGNGAFLGQFRSDYTGESILYDLWYEPQPGIGPTVVARYGPDGDYYSGMIFSKPYTDVTGERQPGIPMLVEARSRAVACGFDVEGSVFRA